MERLIAAALSAASQEWVDERDPAALGLDFYLPDQGVHIEVKRMHSPRISEQMRRSENVIVAQGPLAVALLARLIEGHRP